MAVKNITGVICADEAYSKAELLARLNISQKCWDKMLDDGLPFSQLGKSRWVNGQDLIDYLSKNAQQKRSPHVEA